MTPKTNNARNTFEDEQIPKYEPPKKIITQIQCFEATDIESLQNSINQWLAEFAGVQIVRVDVQQIHAPYFTTQMRGTVVYKTYAN